MGRVSYADRKKYTPVTDSSVPEGLCFFCRANPAKMDDYTPHQSVEHYDGPYQRVRVCVQCRNMLYYENMVKCLPAGIMSLEDKQTFISNKVERHAENTLKVEMATHGFRLDTTNHLYIPAEYMGLIDDEGKVEAYVADQHPRFEVDEVRQLQPIIAMRVLGFDTKTILSLNQHIPLDGRTRNFCKVIEHDSTTTW